MFQIGIIDFWRSEGLVIGVGGFRFDSRARQIGHNVATAATFLSELGYPGAKPRRWTPPLITHFSDGKYNKDLIFNTSILQESSNIPLQLLTCLWTG